MRYTIERQRPRTALPVLPSRESALPQFCTKARANTRAHARTAAFSGTAPAYSRTASLSGLVVSIAVLAVGALRVPASDAATFSAAPISPALGLDVLDRSVSEERLERALLAEPYAVAAIGTLDLYDVFPYVESRFFVVVSDPAWNRIGMTETGSGTLSAFDGAGTEVGPLSNPRGLAVDRAGWLYVCDTDNDRILALEPHIEYDRITLRPRGTVEGLSRPLDIAPCDAGTPFDASDDRLYVVESGRNQITRIERAGESFVATESIGGLGAGPGFFAGPTAIASTSSGGATHLYVAEAHTGAIVHVEDGPGGLRWLESRPVGLGTVTGLASDRFGNLYATSPQSRSVTKLTGGLDLLATLPELNSPKDFFVPFVRIEDHRTGRSDWSSHGSGVLVERWDRNSGLRLIDLGVDVSNLRARSEAGRVEASFLLTDPAEVTLRLLDPATEEIVAQRSLGSMPAGESIGQLSDADFVRAADSGDYVVEVAARSGQGSGDHTPVVNVRTPVSLDRSVTGAAVRFAGVHPNPFVTDTEFRFALPGHSSESVEVELFDPSGRRIRRLSVPPGQGFLRWDGRDESGNDPGSGVYLYRVRMGDWERSGKVVRIR